MKGGIKLSVILVVAILSLVLFCYNVQAKSGQETRIKKSECTIYGTIKDEYGNPVEDAWVHLDLVKGEGKYTRSGIDGRYSFKELRINKQYRMHVDGRRDRQDLQMVFTDWFLLDEQEQKMDFILRNLSEGLGPKYKYKKDEYGNYYHVEKEHATLILKEQFEEEMVIWQEGFKYMIGKYSWPKKRNLFFITIYLDHKPHDPPPTLLSKLEGAGYKLKGQSQSEYSNKKGCMVDKATGYLAEELGIEGITWVTEDKVCLFAYEHAGNVGFEGLKLYLEKKEGKWVVTGEQITGMS